MIKFPFKVPLKRGEKSIKVNAILYYLEKMHSGTAEIGQKTLLADSRIRTRSRIETHRKSPRVNDEKGGKK